MRFRLAPRSMTLNCYSPNFLGIRPNVKNVPVSFWRFNAGPVFFFHTRKLTKQKLTKKETKNKTYQYNKGQSVSPVGYTKTVQEQLFIYQLFYTSLRLRLFNSITAARCVASMALRGERYIETPIVFLRGSFHKQVTKWRHSISS